MENSWIEETQTAKIYRKKTNTQHTHKEKTKGADRKKALLLFYLTIFLLAIFILHTLLLGQSVGGFRHFTSNFLFWPEKNQSGQETKRPLAKRRRSVGTKHCECKQNSSKPYLFMTRLGQDKAQRLWDQLNPTPPTANPALTKNMIC